MIRILDKAYTQTRAFCEVEFTTCVYVTDLLRDLFRQHEQTGNHFFTLRGKTVEFFAITGH